MQLIDVGGGSPVGGQKHLGITVIVAMRLGGYDTVAAVQSRRADLESVRQSGLARLSILVALMAVVVGLVAWRWPRNPSSAPAFTATYACCDASFVAPLAPAAMPQPPLPARGTSVGCTEWASWLEDAEAQLSGDWHAIQLRAAAKAAAAVTVTQIRPVVQSVRAVEHSTQFFCVLGGGGNPAFTAEIDLDSPDSPVPISEFEDSGPPLLIPPGSLEVGPGLIEQVDVRPTGTANMIYQFRLEIEYVVDGAPKKATLDNGGEPFVFAFAESNMCWPDPLRAAWTDCAHDAAVEEPTAISESVPARPVDAAAICREGSLDYEVSGEIADLVASPVPPAIVNWTYCDGQFLLLDYNPSGAEASLLGFINVTTGDRFPFAMGYGDPARPCVSSVIDDERSLAYFVELFGEDCPT